MSNHWDQNQQCTGGSGGSGSNPPPSRRAADGRQQDCVYYPNADRIGFPMQGMQQPVHNAMPFFQHGFNGVYSSAPSYPFIAVTGTVSAAGACYPEGQAQFRPEEIPSFALPDEPDMVDSSLMNWARRTVESAEHEEDSSLDSHTQQEPAEPAKGQKVTETTRRESMAFRASPVEGTFGSKKAKTQLPKNFKPGSHSVILGRGRCTESAGNKRFKQIVNNHLAEYVEAPGKLEKTFVSIVSSWPAMHTYCPYYMILANQWILRMCFAMCPILMFRLSQK